MKSHGKGHSDDAFATDDRNFHAAPVAGQDYERCQTLIQEVREFDFFARLVNDSMMGKLDEFQVRPDYVEFALRNGVENMIGDDLATAVHPCSRTLRYIQFFVSNIRRLQTCSSYKPAQIGVGQ